MASAKHPKHPKQPKQRRVTQACDYCHGRSVRCRPLDGGGCQNCRDFDQECTYNRVPRRRGVRRRAGSAQEGLGGQPEHNGLEAADRTPTTPSTPACPPTPSGLAQPVRKAGATASNTEDEKAPWEPAHVASHSTIVNLVELYFEIVYPIFPFFHQPTFVLSTARGDYLRNRMVFAVTMSVCALVSARIRDGCVTNPHWDLSALREPAADIFYYEARRQLVELNPLPNSFNEMRSHAVLAIAAIQNGRDRDMQQHIATYHTLVAMDGIQDESNWPKDIGTVEKEERRRLFWSTYTLDVFTSVVWGGVLRSREQQCNVAYPREVDDEFIRDSHSPGPEWPVEPRHCWLRGWNFITDLYRVMEHALTRFRYDSNRPRRRNFVHELFEDRSSSVTEASVQQRVMARFESLPACFKETPPFTYNAKQDRFGFQAANIIASLQLLRMILFAASGASISERCGVVGQVVDAFVPIPSTYLLAIGTPLLHHLGGISAILGTVSAERLSQDDRDQAQTVMKSMQQLLDNIRDAHQAVIACTASRPSRNRVSSHSVPVVEARVVGDSAG